MKLTVVVAPRSSRNEIEKKDDGSLKIYLTVPPVDGEANKKVIELLSKEFGIAKSLIQIVKGKTSKQKVIEINI